MKIIELKNIIKNIGKKKLFQLDYLEVNTNEIIGIIGGNGVGKTTLLKTIIGVSSFSSGEINYFDNKFKEKIGVVLDQVQLFEHLKGIDNLKYMSLLYDVPSQKTEKIIRLFKMEDYINDKVKNYSLGMQKKLMLAMSIIHEPKILLLDEPFNGIDSKSYMDIKNIIYEIKKNTAVIMTSHDEQTINDLCDKVLKIQNNEIKEIEITDNTTIGVLLETNKPNLVIDIITNNMGEKSYLKPYLSSENHIKFHCTKHDISTIVDLLVSEQKEIAIYKINYKKFSLK